ncbi:MAG: hypothetical protein HC819_20455 [Cyclobacteriaceae bacterium]|nr:hypothetical protein [Cyclobacteriaceae bacterium]
MRAQDQNQWVFDGQASVVANYAPDNEGYGLLMGRYLPELYYDLTLDSSQSLYFEGSANIYGSATFFKGDSSRTDGAIQPYRIWMRYIQNKFELRIGLQKIDFGSATVLRPLQWFNEIDPRDPLGLTNGVYAALGRYYFSNNANIWMWMLYGNDRTNGLDIINSNKKAAEFGGRIQYPVPRGELALSYHHRSADASELLHSTDFANIPEDRYGIDGKWDVEIGIWFELSYIHKHEELGILTHQNWLTVGADYTFGIGNGLNVALEHLVTGHSDKRISFENGTSITATTLSYPISFFDKVNTVAYYNWRLKDVSFFLNYEHQFKKLTGHVMGYYNPKTPPRMQEFNFVNNFAGPGLRLMLVYNH